MPSADFCAAVRRPFDLLSRSCDTTQTSRGKTDSLPHPPPNLRSTPLVDMDFVVDRPLVRRSRLISGSCSSVHAFAPRFLQTPPRDDALALRYPFTSTRLGRGLSPPSCRSCPAHDPSARTQWALGRDDETEGINPSPTMRRKWSFAMSLHAWRSSRFEGAFRSSIALPSGIVGVTDSRLRREPNVLC